MVLNATFNNISVISWRSALLVEETGVPGENGRPVASHRQTLLHNVVSSTPRHERDSNSRSRQRRSLFMFIILLITTNTALRDQNIFSSGEHVCGII